MWGRRDKFFIFFVSNVKKFFFLQHQRMQMDYSESRVDCNFSMESSAFESKSVSLCLSRCLIPHAICCLFNHDSIFFASLSPPSFFSVLRSRFFNGEERRTIIDDEFVYVCSESFFFLFLLLTSFAPGPRVPCCWLFMLKHCRQFVKRANPLHEGW